MSGIIICGLNGSGKSTLGKELARLLDYKLIDVEDYYFIKSDSNYKYNSSHTKNEVIKLILEDINKNENFVMTSVIGDYGDNIISKYSCAIMIYISKEESLKRVKKRSYEQYGDRVLLGGDLYDREMQFFEKVKLKSNDNIEKWVNTLECPIIKIDGTKSISYNIKFIIDKLSNM